MFHLTTQRNAGVPKFAELIEDATSLLVWVSGWECNQSLRGRSIPKDLT